jgi:hypothetical protein
MSLTEHNEKKLSLQVGSLDSNIVSFHSGTYSHSMLPLPTTPLYPVYTDSQEMTFRGDSLVTFDVLEPGKPDRTSVDNATSQPEHAPVAEKETPNPSPQRVLPQLIIHVTPYDLDATCAYGFSAGLAASLLLTPIVAFSVVTCISGSTPASYAYENGVWCGCLLYALLCLGVGIYLFILSTTTRIYVIPAAVLFLFGMTLLTCMVWNVMQLWRRRQLRHSIIAPEDPLPPQVLEGGNNVHVQDVNILRESGVRQGAIVHTLPIE